MKRSLAVILVLFIICLQAGCSAKIIHHTPSKPLLQVEVGDTRELEIMLLKPTLRKSAYLWECDEGEFIKKDMGKAVWQAPDKAGIKSVKVRATNTWGKTVTHEWQVLVWDPEDWDFYSQEKTVVFVRYLGEDEDVAIPHTVEGKRVTRIDPEAFKKNKTITSVKIPRSVKWIGSKAFYDCEQLKEVEFYGERPAGEYLIFETATSFQFCGCDALTLKSVNNIFDEKIIDMKGTFMGCVGIKGELTIPKRIIKMERAFSAAKISKLSFERGSKLVEIGKLSFGGNGSLKTVILPPSVKRFGYGAFWGCENMETFVYTADELPIIEFVDRMAPAFYGTNEKCKYYIPSTLDKETFRAVLVEEGKAPAGIYVGYLEELQD